MNCCAARALEQETVAARIAFRSGLLCAGETESGNTGCVWESRPHPDYLGPRWWADLRDAVSEAKKLGLEVWIFDEWMYPSGVAGGRVVAENPVFALHTLEERSIAVQGPAQTRYWDAGSALRAQEKLISVVAFPDPYRATEQPVELKPEAGGTPGMPMPWSCVLPEYFRKLKGYDPRPWLPALWYDLGSRAFAENFFKPQRE